MKVKRTGSLYDLMIPSISLCLFKNFDIYSEPHGMIVPARCRQEAVKICCAGYPNKSILLFPGTAFIKDCCKSSLFKCLVG